MTTIAHAYVYRGSEGLLEKFRLSESRLSNLVIVDEIFTEGLDKTESKSYGLMELTDSISRIKTSSEAKMIGLPSFLEIGNERYGQTVYRMDHITPTGDVAVFERNNSGKYNGAGIIIMGLNTNIIADIMRRYGLPFPADFKKIRS